ncbi:zf-HC2 domain-containing protein, partial [Peribacillus sp. SIMBA_075]
MTCLDKVMLDAFLEDRLSFEEKQEIQHHLMTCSSCLNRFEQYMD